MNLIRKLKEKIKSIYVDAMKDKILKIDITHIDIFTNLDIYKLSLDTINLLIAEEGMFETAPSITVQEKVNDDITSMLVKIHVKYDVKGIQKIFFEIIDLDIKLSLMEIIEDCKEFTIDNIYNNSLAVSYDNSFGDETNKIIYNILTKPNRQYNGKIDLNLLSNDNARFELKELSIVHNLDCDNDDLDNNKNKFFSSVKVYYRLNDFIPKNHIVLLCNYEYFFNDPYIDGMGKVKEEGSFHITTRPIEILPKEVDKNESEQKNS